MWGEGQGVKKKKTFENMELTQKILSTLKMKASKKIDACTFQQDLV